MRLFPVLGLTVLACGAASHPPSHPLDVSAARTAVDKVVQAQYEALRTGDSDAFLQAADPEGFMMGIVHSRRTPEFLAELHKAIDPMVKRGMKFGVTSTALTITVSASGRAAWVSDSLDFAIGMGEHTMNMTQRFTEVLGEQGGKWTVLADHMSMALPSSVAPREPEEIPDGVGPGAAAIVTRLDQLLANPAQLAPALSEREDSVIFLSDPGILKGLAAKHALETAGQELTFKRLGGMRAGLTADGQTGWAACNIGFSRGDFGVTRVRLLIVFTLEHGDWKIVQVHVSKVPPEMG